MKLEYRLSTVDPNRLRTLHIVVVEDEICLQQEPTRFLNLSKDVTQQRRSGRNLRTLSAMANRLKYYKLIITDLTIKQ